MDELIGSLPEHLEGYSAADRERILSAASWTGELYRDEHRASGEPYLVHPIEVAKIIAGLQLDADSVIAGLLHESIGDRKTKREEIATRYGESAALLVEGVTKIADLAARNKTQAEAESIRKMLFAMVKDIRVILIKLADKLHNMRTLQYLAADRQKITAQECLDIYAPLADRLGISGIKDELEDLSLKHLNREAFDQIKRIVSAKKGEREDYLKRLKDAIHSEVAGLGIRIEVSARAKHFYSIYQKMRKRNKAADELYDLLGLRIFCDETDDCYTLLGAVHRIWKPIEGRFKDYIAMPKSNGYRSLHTTVMGFEGRLIEIQIRTHEMHRIAEFGVASHWLYKKGSTKDTVRVEDLSIVNRLKDWNREEEESGHAEGSISFLESIKEELLKDSIYVFTPQGKVIELPAGSTPIDFAFQIHSAIGEHCIGAKADGQIVPLTAELKNTQVVEILTSPQAKPNINWLRAARTAKARNKIRAWLLENDESLIIERNIVAKKQPHIEVAPPPPPAQPPVLTPVLNQIHPLAPMQVRVEDEKNMMIRFAQCCHPVTGDPIIGYVSRGRGIIIHRKTCRNVELIPDFTERMIEVEWENANSHLVKRFRVEAKSSTDLFSEIEGAVRKRQGHLVEGRLEQTSANRLTGFFTVELESRDDLKQVLKNIRGIPSVLTLQVVS